MRQAASLTASLLTDKDGTPVTAAKPKQKKALVGSALRNKGAGAPALNTNGATSHSPIAKSVTKVKGGGNLARPGSRRPLVAEPAHRKDPGSKDRSGPDRTNGKATEKAPVGSGKRIAMTLRLDHDLHTELKVHAAMRKQTAQQVLLDALEAHLPASRRRRKHSGKSA